MKRVSSYFDDYYDNYGYYSRYYRPYRTIRPMRILSKKIFVKFNKSAFDKTVSVFKKFANRGLEVGAYLIGTKKEDKNKIEITVEDVVFPVKQIITSGNFEFLKEAEQEIFDLIFEQKVIGLIHSHHYMNAFFSTTDDRYGEQNVQIEGQRFLSIVFAFDKKSKILPKTELVKFDAKLFYNESNYIGSEEINEIEIIEDNQTLDYDVEEIYKRIMNFKKEYEQQQKQQVATLKQQLLLRLFECFPDYQQLYKNNKNTKESIDKTIDFVLKNLDFVREHTEVLYKTVFSLWGEF